MSFMRPTSTISSKVPFQLAISSPKSARLSRFTFESLHIHFNDDRPPIEVRHSSDLPSSTATTERYEIKREEAQNQANLRWDDGMTKVFYGTVSSAAAISLTVSARSRQLLLAWVRLTLHRDPGRENRREPINRQLEPICRFAARRED